MKIVCDDKIPFLRGVFEPYADVVYLPGKKTTAEVVKDADAIITRTRTKCDKDLLEGSAVKVIATATIGFDHIDTAYVESKGILWKNCPGCNSWSVKQYVAAALVTLAKKYSLELDKMTLGVVGVGNVGSKVAEVGRLLGMKVLLNDPPRAKKEGGEGFCSLGQICENADIITLHVPLEEDTRHLFDYERLASLGKDKILINSSRGPVVDNAALKTVLKAGGLKAAVIDVWESEPDLDSELVALTDISTPHIAGYSADGKANGTWMSVETVSQTLGIEALKGWRPLSIPAPAQSLEFEIDAEGKTDQQVLSEAILHSYDIEADSAALRADLGAFESLRGDYPVRREFTAFNIKIKGGNISLEGKLTALGFNILK